VKQYENSEIIPSIFFLGNLKMKDVLNTVVKTVKIASKRLIDIKKQGYETNYKTEKDPVTTADLEVNRILETELRTSFPDFGWLSEETQDNNIRLRKQFVWLVDPIDGTREFVANIPEYTISVALIKEKSPVLGVVLNPSTNELFTTIKGEGVWLNGKRIKANHKPEDKLVLIVSRTDINMGLTKPFASFTKI